MSIVISVSSFIEYEGENVTVTLTWLSSTYGLVFVLVSVILSITPIVSGKVASPTLVLSVK